MCALGGARNLLAARGSFWHATYRNPDMEETVREFCTYFLCVFGGLSSFCMQKVQLPQPQIKLEERVKRTNSLTGTPGTMAAKNVSAPAGLITAYIPSQQAVLFWQ